MKVSTVIFFLIFSCQHCLSQKGQYGTTKLPIGCDGDTFQINGEKVTIDAEFPGGKSALENFIKTNIRKQVLSDNVMVPFIMTIRIIINKKGRIDGESIQVNEDDRHLCESCALEAKRLVTTMPDWIPAYNIVRGKQKYVSSEVLIDIKFE